jgi:hypothetical protein
MDNKILRDFFDAVADNLGYGFGYHENAGAVKAAKERLWEKFVNNQGILEGESDVN